MWSFLTTGKYWLIAIAVATVVAFGSGFFLATSQAEDKLVAGAAEAYSKGTDAQARYDAGEFKKAQADSARRQVADEKRDTVVAAIEQAIPTLVPPVAACTVSAEAMKRLNEVVQ